MCPTCLSLTNKIAAAILSGDRERERIMTVLLESHHKDCHPALTVVAWTGEAGTGYTWVVPEAVGSEG
jgi:hypothetical protein